MAVLQSGKPGRWGLPSGVSLAIAVMMGGTAHGQTLSEATVRQNETQRIYQDFFQASPTARRDPKNVDPQRAELEKAAVQARKELQAVPAAPSAPGEAAARQEKTRQLYRNFFETQTHLFNDLHNLPKVAGAMVIPTDLRDRLSTFQELAKRVPLDPAGLIADDLFHAELINPDLSPTDRIYLQVALWNEIALDMTALDHTQLPAGQQVSWVPTEQVGPARTSRAMAMTHLSIFEAVNAILPKYKSYKGLQAKLAGQPNVPAMLNLTTVSAERAIAEAAFKTLSGLYPSKTTYLSELLLEIISRIPDDPARQLAGRGVGDAVASAVLAERKFDGSDLPDPGVETFQTLDPEKWHPDPLNPELASIALGANWLRVKPFVVERSDQFRPPPPPSFHDPAFALAYTDVKSLGGDLYADPNLAPAGSRASTDTQRTGAKKGLADFGKGQTFVGKFWAYDGTPYLCAPPRLYNMIATSLAYRETKIADPTDFARYLALLNLAMGDAAICAWEAKFFYLYPRPVTGIRAAAVAQLPFTSALDDHWTPLGAQISNGGPSRQNVTPPFPAYPSGHAVFGGAFFQILRKLNGITPRPDPSKKPDPLTNAEKPALFFKLISDEYNGLNHDAGDPAPRPAMSANFPSLGDAEWDNGQSRVYLGIHWSFDAVNGSIQGNQIADYVFAHTLEPLAP